MNDGPLRTPGVYVGEAQAFPPSVVGVPTHIPVFVGYTERAADAQGRDLKMQPVSIASLADFQAMFGGRFQRRYYLTAGAVPPGDRALGTPAEMFLGAPMLQLVEAGGAGYYLYDSLLLFFMNGGSDCVIVSCGDYSGGIHADALIAGIQASASALDPSMVVVPDAARLAAKADFDRVAAAMLGSTQPKADRMAILDVWGAEALGPRADFGPVIAAFRKGLEAAPVPALAFAASYFPALETSLIGGDDVTMASFDLAEPHRQTLVDALTAAVGIAYPGRGGPDPQGQAVLSDYVAAIGQPGSDDAALARQLAAAVPGFANLLATIAASQSLLPPSGAMAGVWAGNDQRAGVWNDPANLGIVGLVQPNVAISDAQQADLNVPLDGMAVNAIRYFPGIGPRIWGARTLDGNSQDWRYIQVRRTVIYIEQSIATALRGFVFEPNVSTTWSAVASMIAQFLTQLWAAGGLQGASACDAFAVSVGLGATMTADDVVNGVLRASVALAITHPAEFITLDFEQQLQQ